jgi:hypothetical protein
LVNNKPYQEIIISKGIIETVIRRFPENTEAEELKWHWDEEDRIIHTMNETDWKIQLDNELPKSMKSKICIPKGKWHRLIKGTGDLQLIVEKHRDI